MKYFSWLPESLLLLTALVLWAVGWPLYWTAQRFVDAAEWLDEWRYQ